jgi:hypothetical protein
MSSWLWYAGGAVAVFTALLFRARKATAAPLTIASTDIARAKALTPDWTDDDFRAFHAIAGRQRMASADALLVLAGESGLKPSAVYRRAGDGFPVAVGLPQLTSAANTAAGITEAERLELPSKSVAYQLPIVERLFSNYPWTKAGKTYDHAGIIYGMNFAPSIVMKRGAGRDVVLYTKGPKESGGDGVYYDQNVGLDLNKDGKITMGDLIDYMRGVAKKPVYQAGLTRLRAVTGLPGLEPRVPA